KSILVSTKSVNWKDLDNCWARRFLNEAKDWLDQESFAALKIKFTAASRSIKRISKEDNVSGGPDFIYKRVDRFLLEVEVKTLWVLNIRDNERHKDEPCALHISSTIEIGSKKSNSFSMLRIYAISSQICPGLEETPTPPLSPRNFDSDSDDDDNKILKR
ncbi:12051_t:CDS:2, partial [Gigaspora margarita]